MTTKTSIIGYTSAWLPIAMSIAALALVVGYVSIFGISQHKDEGTAAHLFQLLLAGQLPIIAYFAIKRLPQNPKQAIQVLVIQFLAGVLAFTPVLFFKL
jgi:hypothetical protein